MYIALTCVYPRVATVKCIPQKFYFARLQIELLAFVFQLSLMFKSFYVSVSGRITLSCLCLKKVCCGEDTARVSGSDPF